MGCNAALMTRRVIDNAFDVLAIQTLAVVQAIDFLKCQPRLSPFSHSLYENVRAIVGPIVEDKPRYNDIKLIRQYLLKLGAAVKL